MRSVRAWEPHSCFLPLLLASSGPVLNLRAAPPGTTAQWAGSSPPAGRPPPPVCPSACFFCKSSARPPPGPAGLDPPSNSAFVLTPLAEKPCVSQSLLKTTSTFSDWVGAGPTTASSPWWRQHCLPRNSGRPVTARGPAPQRPTAAPPEALRGISAPARLFSRPARSSNLPVSLSGHDSPDVDKPQLDVHTTPPAREMWCGLLLTDMGGSPVSPSGDSFLHFPERCRV